MDMQFLTNAEIFSWIILPILIFLSRIVDVSIGTMRIIYVSRGMKLIASICGFFEVLIWLIAITQIMQHLTNFFMYFAYAGGFAVGNYIGIIIEKKLAVGYVAIQIVTKKDSTGLIDILKEKEYGVTSLNAYGLNGIVQLIFTVVRRKDLDEVMEIIKQFNPKAFFSIEDVRTVREGIFPRTGSRTFASLKTVRKFK